MRGRASTLTDLDDGRLLRRGGNPFYEATVMEHARGRGYPVPKVYEVRGDGLVLERIEGPTMLGDSILRPWRIPANMRTLARLHDDLHAIEAPHGSGMLLHLDLHPENVLLSQAGPVVIDWTNARGGQAALDPALAWLILMTSGGPLGRFAAPFFLREFDREAVLRALPDACAYRLADENTFPRERVRVERLRRRYG